MLDREANREDTDQTASSDCSRSAPLLLAVLADKKCSRF